MIMCHNVFNGWPRTALLLPVWRRDGKRLELDTAVTQFGVAAQVCRHRPKLPRRLSIRGPSHTLGLICVLKLCDKWQHGPQIPPVAVGTLLCLHGECHPTQQGCFTLLIWA